MKKRNLSYLAVAMLALSPLAQADFVGTISDDTYRTVGESDIWIPFYHSTGYAGIGSDDDSQVDFYGLADDINDDDVYISDSYHTDSVYNFMQIASEDIWFGEWYESETGGVYTNRAVYYIGDDTGTTMPTSGSASYTVAGINQYEEGNLMAGELNVDFDALTVDGDFENDTLKIDIDATIDASDASFAGTATATQDEIDTVGATVGNFFGEDAAYILGIATFDDTTLDTAFGGAK